MRNHFAAKVENDSINHMPKFDEWWWAFNCIRLFDAFRLN